MKYSRNIHGCVRQWLREVTIETCIVSECWMFFFYNHIPRRSTFTRMLTKLSVLDIQQENAPEDETNLFNTAALQDFLTRTYSGATLLEERQVSAIRDHHMCES